MRSVCVCVCVRWDLGGGIRSLLQAQLPTASHDIKAISPQHGKKCLPLTNISTRRTTSSNKNHYTKFVSACGLSMCKHAYLLATVCVLNFSLVQEFMCPTHSADLTLLHLIKRQNTLLWAATEKHGRLPNMPHCFLTSDLSLQLTCIVSNEPQWASAAFKNLQL